MTDPSVAPGGRKENNKRNVCASIATRKKRFRHGRFARGSKARGRCRVFLSLLFFFSARFSNNRAHLKIQNKTKQKNSPAAMLRGVSVTETGATSRSSGTSTLTACRGSSRTRRATRTSPADRRGTTSKSAPAVRNWTCSRYISPSRIRANAICLGSSRFSFRFCLFVCSFGFFKIHFFFSLTEIK